MGHDHDHAPPADALGGAFALGVALNLAFVAIEAGFGVAAHSTALLADAAHNASDVLGLAFAWGAAALARRAPSPRRTYGLRSSTVLAALANGVLLLVAIGGVSWEAVRRLANPEPVAGTTIIVVAAAGVLINTASALLFLRDRKRDANVNAAFLHLAADAGVSLGVVVSGVLVTRTGWYWLDPAASLLVSVVVLGSTWGLLRDALHLALDGVPPGIDFDAVQAYLRALPDVSAVHDLHIWAMGTTETALTAHLVTVWREQPPEFLAYLEHELHERFGIDHTTVQLEPTTHGEACRLAPDHVV